MLPLFQSFKAHPHIIAICPFDMKLKALTNSPGTFKGHKDSVPTLRCNNFQLLAGVIGLSDYFCASYDNYV